MRNKYDAIRWEEKFDQETEDTVHYDNIVDNSVQSYNSYVEENQEQDDQMDYESYVSQCYYGA